MVRINKRTNRLRANKSRTLQAVFEKRTNVLYFTNNVICFEHSVWPRNKSSAFMLYSIYTQPRSCISYLIVKACLTLF